MLLRPDDELLRLEEALERVELEREELALLRLADDELLRLAEARLDEVRLDEATLRPERPVEDERLTDERFMDERLTDEREAPPPRLTLLERVAPPKADALVLFLATLWRPLFSGPYRWRFTW